MVGPGDEPWGFGRIWRCFVIKERSVRFVKVVVVAAAAVATRHLVDVDGFFVDRPY
jgi:hypothetical protein